MNRGLCLAAWSDSGKCVHIAGLYLWKRWGLWRCLALFQKQIRQNHCWLPQGMEQPWLRGLTRGSWPPHPCSSPMQPTVGFKGPRCSAGSSGMATQHQRHQNRVKKIRAQWNSFLPEEIYSDRGSLSPASPSSHPFWVPVTVRAALTTSSPTSLSQAPLGEPGQVSGLGSLGTSSGAPIPICMPTFELGRERGL